jgi:hypothetical protein
MVLAGSQWAERGNYSTRIVLFSWLVECYLNNLLDQQKVPNDALILARF